jgi:riboflavin kinase / FMN adenylyltransferase
MPYIVTQRGEKPMRLFHGTESANVLRPTVLTMGVFDGLHLGHQLIMRTVVERAKEINATPTVITFDPHPRAVLFPESAPPLLQTLDQRLNAFSVLGIEQTIVIPFSRELAQQPAEEFLKDIVNERLQAKEAYLGQGFFFGKDREGNIELLRRVSKQLGFFADEISEVRLRNKRISSSKIRGLLLDGHVNLARRMLGRPYGVEGRVIHGAERGRTIGYPTANLQPQNRVIPKRGVYVTSTLINDRWRRSITNIGIRPTFEKDVEPSVESYVLDWEGNLYGDVIRIRFLHRIRDEKKFNSIDELTTQIKKDVSRAANYFERSSVKNSLAII